MLIYARYSTDDQDVSSIADQVAYCKSWLEQMEFTDIEIEVISDAELSGELRRRPGMDRVWAGTNRPDWDLIICEDASRLYRNETFLMELAETAIDNGMRLICINDDVDSTDEGWRDRLREAGHQHAKANHYTRMRILRKKCALWEMGAAIGPLRVGYKRTPSIPATEHEPAKGPFFDSIDENLAPLLAEAYERIGNGEATWTVGMWLKEKGVPGSCARKRVSRRWLLGLSQANGEVMG